ncbi:MAG: signal transduction histidine kinase [Verrucomicrobiales bacterium]|jgi:signal transduction histidine kinase
MTITITRPSTVWTVFAVCIAVLLAAMAWVTANTLHLEQARRTAEQDRELQERVRLALWRMDSAAGALVVAENARPANHFRDFHPVDQAYTSTYQILQKGDVILPSPLLNEIPNHAQLYCELGANGKLTSPQVPSGNNRDLAEQNYVSKQDIDASAKLLEQAREIFPTTGYDPPAALTSEQAQPPAEWSEQQMRNSEEFIVRSQSKEKTDTWGQNTSKQVQIRPRKAIVQKQAEDAGITIDSEERTASFQGIWRDTQLFLVRDATVDGENVRQGIWLNAEKIRNLLLDEIRDLLPAAALIPVRDPSVLNKTTPEAMKARTRYLASLPFQLEPGEVAVAVPAFWSPVRRSLTFAWTGAIAAAIAAGALIFGIVRLSERRAAFVSAVTHEMRTPLTTFRLYSEMLATDMVKDEDKRQAYFSTLTSEADRLSHLVENVLAYSQLERGSARTRIEETTLQKIVDRVLPRLVQRASMADIQVRTDISPAAGNTRINVDLTAVEQIFFNLVDNACKYAHPADDEDTCIHIEADIDGPMALLRVRDHGRGISKNEEKRLFRPFEKSATDAAHSAPGVGLGLALCRKLARALGGELKLCRKLNGGCFVLALPASAAGQPSPD